ncbi:MAG: response regulator [Novosphingobium sp.]|nr:response regulator [Novosphingobium sp.]
MTTPIRVLQVEDNEADAFLTRETMERSKLTVDFTTVIDGDAARAYLLREPPYEEAPRPDLLLLDLNLPGMNGQQLLKEIRQHDHLKTLPVVVLTSSDAERDILMSYELGANCYVTKPVGLEAFEKIVRSIECFWFTVVRLP